MARCEECIHEKVCVIKAFPDAFENTEWSKEPCDLFLTADVVPKNELEAEHNRWLKLVNENNMLENKLYWARQEVAREIFEEIEYHIECSSLCSLDQEELLGCLNLMKEKYTEEERYEEIHSDRLCR